MKEIFLSQEGYFAVTSFIGQLWSMSNLGLSNNPTSYILMDAQTQRHIDYGIYEIPQPLHVSKEKTL